MRFPVVFTRTASGGTGLAADSVPTGVPTPSSTNSNQLASRNMAIAGWPCHRVAVAYLAPSGSVAVPASLYFYEDQTQAWYRSSQAPKRLIPGQLTFFDIVSLIDPPVGAGTLSSPSSTSFVAALVIGAQGSAPNGTHTFAMAPDMTTIGEDLPEQTRPATHQALVTPSDTADLPDGPCRSVFVGVAGTVALIAEDDAASTQVTWTIAAVPYVIPVAARRVMSTNTTSTNIIALY